MPYVKIFLCFFAFVSAEAWAQEEQIGSLSAVVGKVTLLRENEIKVASTGEAILRSDQIITSKNAFAQVVFVDGSNISIPADSSIDLAEYGTEEEAKEVSIKSVMSLIRGKARFFFFPGKKRDAKVYTRNSVLGIRGTTFVLEQSPSTQTQLVVLKGEVTTASLSAPTAEVLVKQGQTTTIEKDAPPAEPKTLPEGDLARVESEIRKPKSSKAEKLVADGDIPQQLNLPKQLPAAKVEQPKVTVTPVPVVVEKIEQPEEEQTPEKKSWGLIFSRLGGGFSFVNADESEMSPDTLSPFRISSVVKPSVTLNALGMQVGSWAGSIFLEGTEQENYKAMGRTLDRSLIHAGIKLEYAALELRSLSGDERSAFLVGASLGRIDVEVLKPGTDSDFLVKKGGAAFSLHATYEQSLWKHLGFHVAGRLTHARLTDKQTSPSSEEELKRIAEQSNSNLLTLNSIGVSAGLSLFFPL